MRASAMPFEPERLLAALEKLPAKNTWWVAFSGGADSTALLLALSGLEERIPARLRALHVDHGLHPASGEWSAHCETVCRELGIPLQLARVAPGRDRGRGLEAEARRLRYQVAEDTLAAGDVLLTAHHADDQAETIIMNLMRGSGVDGLAGMPETRPLGHALLARPLLGFTGASLRDYLVERGVHWIEDCSNRDLSYDRNFIRHTLLPQLEERWPGAWHNLSLSAQHCREASDFIAARCDALLPPCESGPGILDLECLQAGAGRPPGDDSLKFVLRHWLKRQGASNLPRERLLELLRQLAAADEESHVAIDWDGWVLHRYCKGLWLQRQDDIERCPALDWNTENELDLGPVLGVLRVEGTPPRPGVHLRVGPRQGGEKLASLEGGRRQSVKQLLQQNRVPPWLRDSVPILRQNRRVVAVAGLAMALPWRQALESSRCRLVWEPRDPVLRAVIAPGP